jgi:acyl carrier protein
MTNEHTIRTLIARLLEQPADQVDWRAPLSDLAIGSLVFVEVIVELQEALGVRLLHEDIETVACLEDLIQTLLGKLQPLPSAAQGSTVGEGAAVSRAA